MPKSQLLTVPRLPRGCFQPSWENGGERLEENRAGGRAGRRGDIQRANVSASARSHLRVPSPSPRFPGRWCRLCGSVAPRLTLPARGAALTAPAPLRPRLPPLGREAATSLLLPPLPPASATAAPPRSVLRDAAALPFPWGPLTPTPSGLGAPGTAAARLDCG